MPGHHEHSHQDGRPRCKQPDFDTFDIDVHDCPCGHMYGDHEYSYPSKLSKNQDMVIASCLSCATPGGSKP